MIEEVLICNAYFLALHTGEWLISFVSFVPIGCSGIRLSHWHPGKSIKCTVSALFLATWFIKRVFWNHTLYQLFTSLSLSLNLSHSLRNIFKIDIMKIRCFSLSRNMLRYNKRYIINKQTTFPPKRPSFKLLEEWLARVIPGWRIDAAGNPSPSSCTIWWLKIELRMQLFCRITFFNVAELTLEWRSLLSLLVRLSSIDDDLLPSE